LIPSLVLGIDLVQNGLEDLNEKRLWAVSLQIRQPKPVNIQMPSRQGPARLGQACFWTLIAAGDDEPRHVLLSRVCATRDDLDDVLRPQFVGRGQNNDWTILVRVAVQRLAVGEPINLALPDVRPNSQEDWL
jgi:hypothetical protein